MPAEEDQLKPRRIFSDPRKVSIVETMIWTTATAVVLSFREWLGESFHPVVFYGTIVTLSWRLCLALPPVLAVIIAIAIAFGLSTIYVYFELAPG